MDILKFQNGYVGQKGLVYCGRPKTKRYSFNQLLIGLENPFSCQSNSVAKFQVTSLEECLKEYRKWLFKLLVSYQNCDLNKLQPWEFNYLQHTLNLAEAISKNEVSGLVCWCVNHKSYVPTKGFEKCHTQVLYAACLWLIESGLALDNDVQKIELSSLW